MLCPRKKIIGIGGNIGSGKTTAAKYFRDFGARYLSADRIGQEILPLIRSPLIKRFGPVITSGNRINRKRLRQIAFMDPENLEFLNGLSHPILIEKILARINHFRSGIMVIDAALLFDWKRILKKIDYAILVSSPNRSKEQRARVKGIDKFTFWCIMDKQMSENEMLRSADYVVKNNGSLSILKKRCRKIFKEIAHGC